MPRPRSFVHSRRRRPALALLFGLISLLSGALALAHPDDDLPRPATGPAQNGVRVFLPLIASSKPPAPAGAPVIEAF